MPEETDTTAVNETQKEEAKKDNKTDDLEIKDEDEEVIWQFVRVVHW